MSVRAAFRPVMRASAASLRAAAPVPRAMAIRPSVNFARTFASTSRRMGSGESDSAVAQSLAAEIDYEKEAAQAAPEQPEFIQSFKEHGVWTIEDVAGTDNYTLTRKFGNETLKLTFQVSDLEEGNEPDPEIERPDGAEEFDQPPFISGSLSITKPATPGALLVDLEAGEEGFVITNVALFEKAVAEAEGPEGDYNRRSKYMGPQFEHLDIELQENFNAYLAERGIDETLSSFVLQYCEHKEQKDYVSWLKDVKGFVDA